VLSHNTIRGAAAAAILNAELLASMGKFELLKWRASARVIRLHEMRRFA